MRWKTAVACTIFGTSYGAGVKVDTRSWTNEQLNYQIYMGHIVEDKDVGLWEIFTSSTNISWNGAHDALMVSGGARGIFTAPDTGRVLIMVTMTGWSQSSTRGLLWVEMRTGDSYGNGSYVFTSTSHRMPANSQHNIAPRATIVDPVSGLTPGQRYNLVTRARTSSGGAVLYDETLTVMPIPT